MSGKVKVDGIDFRRVSSLYETWDLVRAMLLTSHHLNPSELALAKGLLSHWTNFAATGSPLRNWEPYSASEGGHRLLHFEEGNTGLKMVDRDTVKNFDEGGMAFWTGVLMAQAPRDQSRK
ncbi:hypothetical protein M427DRAFT_327715 [Gonapodya prolifera JEL478]|uniref:Carboxylesterase type B domain-containing protein n=1 Tax=Gonapodya prolifera (strain JEL478) TaxID=1344416 RepID=A0A139AFI0_GONPJ|nr:hypothetical protein M427DRAFT_327715 [Gonapodya prolifera JEL478]|eukprot:KXS15324.1 hypothetical protein M427DRAFT_327715 [Gonapodya prolifera JEL478]